MVLSDMMFCNVSEAREELATNEKGELEDPQDLSLPDEGLKSSSFGGVHPLEVALALGLVNRLALEE